MSELFGDKRLLTKSYFEELPNVYGKKRDENHGTVAANQILHDKVVCLFFSASWCAPCQHFVPTLRELYSEVKNRKESMEIVFLSFDKTEQEMLDYFKDGHGDWLALPFGDNLREVLAEKYSISVIPKLVVIQPNGNVITTKGRKDIQDKGIMCVRLWNSQLTLSVDEKGKAEDTDAQQAVTVNG